MFSQILFDCVCICSSVSAGIRGGCFKVATARFSLRVQTQLFRSLMSQETGFFDVTKTGMNFSRSGRKRFKDPTRQDLICFYFKLNDQTVLVKSLNELPCATPANYWDVTTSFSIHTNRTTKRRNSKPKKNQKNGVTTKAEPFAISGQANSE